MDSEASTPPPLDLSDLSEPEPSSAQPTSAQPSTSTSGAAWSGASSPESSPSWAVKAIPRIKLKRNRAAEGEKKTSPKKLKQLFGSEEEGEDHEREVEANGASQFSPISSDDETFKAAEECQVQAMDLSTSPKEPAKVEESPQVRSRNNDDIIKELAEKIKRAKALSQASVVPPQIHQSLSLEPLRHIKTEPGLVRVEVPALNTGGYSEEPECITILDSDEESCENDFVEDLVLSLEDSAPEDFISVGGEERPEDPAADSDDEIEIISASETPLFAAIAKNIKVEYDCEEQEVEVEAGDSGGVDHQETIDEACATIERNLEEIKQDELIREVMAEAACRRVNVVEAIEAAKVEYNSSSPTVGQVLHVLLGEDTESERDSDGEDEVFSQAPPQEVSGPASHSSDNIDDLLLDSEDEESFQERVERRAKKQSLSSFSHF